MADQINTTTKNVETKDGTETIKVVDTAANPPAAKKEILAEEGWNIKFVGVSILSNGDKIALEPASGIVPNGNNPIELPSGEQQLAGFKLDPLQASQLARMYPEFYKLKRTVDEMAKVKK